MIKIQIQTIDSCNAKCWKCPHSEVYHNNKVMSMELFEKIINDTIALYGKDTFILFVLYLENEPLLDPLLFKRAELIKEKFSKYNMTLSTNCILLPEFEGKLENYFSRVSLSFYGWDLESYNKIHRTNISKERFKKMQESFDRLSKNEVLYLSKNYKKEDMGTGNLNDILSWIPLNYSRGGFCNNDKILRESLSGCSTNKHKIISILQDGSMILCCMDYRRQTVLGNLNHQSLKEIISSPLYRNFHKKVEGILPSEKDFICKKCELANDR